MTDKYKLSDETLNSFVDGQLSTEEQEDILTAINQDRELGERVCRLRQCKDLVCLAYGEVPEINRVGDNSDLTGYLRSAVATIIIGVAVIVGWTANNVVNDRWSGKASQQATSSGARITSNNRVATSQHKILFHLTRGDLAAAKELLDELEYLLQNPPMPEHKLLVEVIVNSDGLNLLRADTSPFPDRIKRIKQTYDNVIFAACRNTMERLQREQGIAVELLPEAIVIESGVAGVIDRQQNGWAYIRV